MGFQGTADEEDDDRQYDDQRQEVNHESENPGEWRASSPGVVNVYPIHLVLTRRPLSGGCFQQSDGFSLAFCI